MKSLTLALVVITNLLVSSCFANDQPFRAIQEFFAATSAFDHNKLQLLMTDDFQLLEAGEIWDGDKLLSVIQPSNLVRQNYFKLVTVKVQEDSAWVSYWNKAKFTSDGQSGIVFWLESAVLKRAKNGWKIQMLHSTHVDNEKVPSDIRFTEYTSKL